MFIIWGWRAVKAVIGTGQFFCPQCQGDTTYRHIAPRMWFTIFFLPIIPLKQLDRFVECTRCSGAFIEAVLAAPTTAQLEHNLALGNRAAVGHVISRAESLDLSVEAAALEALASAAGVPRSYDRNLLHSDARSFAEPATAAACLGVLAEQISMGAREDLLRRLIVMVERVPRRGSGMDEAIETCADALGISRAYLLGIRESVLRGPSPLAAEGEQ